MSVIDKLRHVLHTITERLPHSSEEARQLLHDAVEEVATELEELIGGGEKDQEPDADAEQLAAAGATVPQDQAPTPEELAGARAKASPKGADA